MIIRKKRAVPLICAIICLIIMGGSMIAVAVLSGSLESQRVAQRWRNGEMRYSQVSVFLPDEAGLSHTATAQLRQSVDNYLAAESIKAPNQNARIWIYAFSGETTVSVSKNTEAVQARAICTGGDFFTFHPVDMASGWYYSDKDIMDDGVIIDRALAWRLYGGYDLTGLSVRIGGYPCKIAGVSNTPERRSENDSYGTEPTVYVPFSLMQKIGQAPNVTCYEAVLPDPVGGFALKTIESAIPYNDGDFEIIENSRRFSPKSNFANIGAYARRTQRTNSVFYPWWENSARYLENFAALFTLLAVISAIYPAALLITLILRLFRRRKTIFRALARMMSQLLVSRRLNEK